MISRRAFLSIVPVFLADRAFAEEPHTPAPGSPERKAIADAMRKTIRKAFGEPDADFLFTFRTLRVQGGWAWAGAAPKRTGSNAESFEDMNCLLRKSDRVWKVVETLPDDVASADDPDRAMRTWLKSIAAKYPGLPKGILPAR